MNILYTLVVCLLSSLLGTVETKPVTSEVVLERFASDSLRVCIDVRAKEGWHIYSTDLPEGGPVSASLSIDSIYGLEFAGDLEFEGHEVEKMDEVFSMKVRYFENNVRFYRDFHITDNRWMVNGLFTFGACNNMSCLPPQRVEIGFSGELYDKKTTIISDSTMVSEWSQIEGYDEAQWRSVISQLSDMDSSTEVRNKSLWGIFAAGVLGGLVALFTPCVWPVIPMTVSLFIKRVSTRRESVRDALFYGLSIVVVYVGLGLLVTVIFGASALNALATNSVPNLIFFLMLVLFAFSFFGLFEFKLPSSWSTGTDIRARSGHGIGSIFLMAVTLTLVSFSCTGPIIGFLLVDAVSEAGIMRPAIGMLGFSIALALPFSLFAMFPGLLKNIPRSGMWMERVKVTLGFVELAFSLKFLSVADMAYGWGVLPRHLFVLLWIIMAVMLSLYLFGVVRFSLRQEKIKPGIVSVMMGIVSLLFALWLVPGLWGAPLKAVSAFTPPMSTQRWNKMNNQIEAQFTDYGEGVEYAILNDKLILLDFTGYGCVNCRKMEAAVWTDADVRDIISEHYVLVSLFVDDKTPLKTPVTVTENGQRLRLRTVGDKWSLFERHKFGSNAQPLYVLLDTDGEPVTGTYSFDPDAGHFREFLLSGINN